MSTRMKVWIGIIIFLALMGWYQSVQETNRINEYKRNGYVESEWHGTAQDCRDQGGFVDETANACVFP